METRREWCQYGTPTQRLLMVMKNYCSLSLGSRRTGTAPTESGMITNLIQLTDRLDSSNENIYNIRLKVALSQ